MKKLLGLTALAAVLVLTACGGNTEETVCTMERWGDEFKITVQSEDGEIISAVMEERIDVSDWDADEIEEEIEWMAEDGLDCDYNSGILVCTETISAEDMDGETDLAEFIDAMEAMGATCN